MTDPANERFAVNIANRMWERAFGRALVEPVIDFPMDWRKHTGQPEVLEFLGQEMVRTGFDLREFIFDLREFKFDLREFKFDLREFKFNARVQIRPARVQI